MTIKMGSCVCNINEEDLKYWENLSRSAADSVLYDGSRYVYKENTGLMYIPSSVTCNAFYESFRTYF